MGGFKQVVRLESLDCRSRVRSPKGKREHGGEGEREGKGPGVNFTNGTREWDAPYYSHLGGRGGAAEKGEQATRNQGPRGLGGG